MFYYAKISNLAVALKSNEFTLILKLNRLIHKMCMSSHVGPSSQETFRKRRRSLQWSMGDNIVKHHGF
jgi:hypothetical protein